jgi:hypothetical protein
MFGLGGPLREEQGMTRDALVDRNGGNPLPDSEKPKVVKGARRAAGGNPPPAQPRWIRPIANYERHQPGGYQVMRFG